MALQTFDTSCDKCRWTGLTQCYVRKGETRAEAAIRWTNSMRLSCLPWCRLVVQSDRMATATSERK